MPDPTDPATDAFPSEMERPFPLRRRYRRRFVPAFLGFLGLLLVLVGLTAKMVTETIYLELAGRRAETIARAVSTSAPAAWKNLMQGQSSLDFENRSDADKLAAAFADEVRELALTDLKVYDLKRRVLFAIRPEEIGTREDGSQLRSLIDDRQPVIRAAKDETGGPQYELYVPLYDEKRHLRAVFELYEPVGYLNRLLLQAAIPALAVPGILLLILAFALDGLVGAAQRDIDARTAGLNDLRHRIESFVSHSAVSAARNRTSSQKLETTLFYSDVRGFTDYSETTPAEAVVAFLNRIMTEQVSAIEAHGGEVDKLIGDAVLVRFDGEDGSHRAVAAARKILADVEQGGYPRRVGIGIYRGEVILGTIGPEQRRDFTVIGDPVNIAARLCSEAKAGQLVVDARLADAEFGPPETIHVKGRSDALEVRRWQVPSV